MRPKQLHLWKKMIALCMTVAMLFSSIWYDIPNVYAASTELTGLTAQQITQQIKIGWNLGNSLDAVSYMADPTPKQSVTAWKNPEPCEALIDRVKATGFNAIRIPVTWFEHLQFDETKNEYVVDEDWMDYVQRVVDWAYNRDMFIILNTHHESWLNVAQWTDETYADSSKKVHDIWSQVAERFKNYDQHLIFESLNEPRQTGNPSVSEWGGGDAYSWDYINKLNQVFVDVVRGTSEQNNERLLMLPTYDATCSITPLRALEIPESSGNVALSVHAYVPYAFAMKADEKHIYEPGERDEWGNDLKTTLKTTMDDLHTISEEKNVPIIIGEFGASDFGNQEERVKWAEDYLTQATTYGFPCFLWDNNVVHYDGDELNGEKYGCINRNNNALYPNNLPILKKMMSVVGVTDAEFYVAPADPFWDTFEIKPEWKTIKKLDCGEKIEGYQGSTLTSNYEYLKEGYRLAVAYEGSSLPKLIFVQYTSNGQDWSLGISAAKDSTTNIAYFDYSDIAKALEGHNLSDVANLTAQTQGQPMTIYGLFAVPLNPTEPSKKPSETSEPVTPSAGSEPAQPSEGSEPVQPSEGIEPTDPSEGIEPTNPSEGSKPDKPSEEKLTGQDAQAIVKQIKIGWNMGNTLDSTTEKTNPTPKDTATAWGNPEPTEALIDRVQKTGFNGIRIPVTWYQHLEFDESKNQYVIDKDWMDYVQQVVDWAYDRDMFIILNLHHEEWVDEKIWTDETLKTATQKMHDIWTQISERFKDYDQHLIFEAMNEPRQTGNPDVAEWGDGNEYSLNYINTLNQTFVDVIRSSDSAANKERLLMIPTYDATNSIAALKPLKVPENGGNIALSIHAYVPYSFAMNADEKQHIYEPGAKDQWGNDLVASLKGTMDGLNQIAQEKNVPIIIGEMGAADFNNQSERVKWAEDYLTQAKNYGFPCFLWDNNVTYEEGDALTGEKFGFINRADNKLYSNSIDVIKKMMEVVGVTDAEFPLSVPDTSTDPFWDTFTIGNDWITVKKFNTGEKIKDYGGVTLCGDLQYLKKGYRFAVVYEGTTLPKLICVDKNWNWLNGVCAAKDSTKNIAYFDYVDIAEVLEGHDLSDIVNLTAQAQGAETTIYGIFAVPHEAAENPFWEKVTVPNDWIKLCKFPNGQTLASYKEANCGKDGINYVKEDYRFAVLYEGKMAPQLVFIDKDWNYLDGIPAASDSSENIAFYDYKDVIKTVSGMTEADINDVRVQALDEEVTVYGLYVAPADATAPSEKPSDPSKPQQPSDTSEPTKPSDTSKPTQPSDTSEPSKPSDTSEPTKPSDTSKPTQPSDTSKPTQPSDTSEPTKPSDTSEPTKPSDTSKPTQPSDTSQPTQPSNGSQPTDPSYGSQPTAPSYGSQPTNPSYGSRPTDPSYGSQPTDPSYGSQPTQPSYGSQPTQPSYGSQPTSPSGGGSSQNPEPSQQPSSIPVQSVTLTPTTLDLKPGDNMQLTYKLQPVNATNKALIWSSSREDVAVVSDSGMVYALSVGEAIISVTTKDGGKQAFCQVTVSPADTTIAVTSLKGNKTSTTLTVKKSFAWKITIKPSNATNKKLTYKTSAKSIATVSQTGVIKAVSPGKATISVKSANGKTAKITVKVIPAKVTGVSAKQPAKGQIKVTWKKQSGISQYQIRYYDPKKGAYTKAKTVTKNSFILKNCKKNATYKFVVRAIKKKSGTTYYGAYSSVAKIKTKK